MKKNIIISLIIFAIFWIVNLLTISIYKNYDALLISNEHLFFISPLFFLIWFHGTKKIFKNLKLEYRLPLLRTIIWIPVVLLDILLRFDGFGFYEEYPIYFLWLNNEILLPISVLPIKINNLIESSFLRSVVLYTDTILIFGFLEILILKIAKKITSYIMDLLKYMNNRHDFEVVLITFNSSTKTPKDCLESENYWKLIGQKGHVLVKHGKLNNERVLVKFDKDLYGFGLINHNEVENTLWILESDLQKK
jgi:hypothetical protein